MFNGFHFNHLTYECIEIQLIFKPKHHSIEGYPGELRLPLHHNYQKFGLTPSTTLIVPFLTFLDEIST